MTAVKKIQTRSKRTLSTSRRTKNTRKGGKQIRFAKPTDGPGDPTDNTTRK
ncbi:MAG TPA: hypothetical protein VFA20_19480 [Myxococcaceae bacterium]|nr:hypothetical protein [Myxococcaceae bacterium]